MSFAKDVRALALPRVRLAIAIAVERCYLVSISVGGVMRHFTVPGWTRKFHSKEPALLHKLLVVESNPVNKVYTVTLVSATFALSRD